MRMHLPPGWAHYCRVLMFVRLAIGATFAVACAEEALFSWNMMCNLLVFQASAFEISFSMYSGFADARLRTFGHGYMAYSLDVSVVSVRLHCGLVLLWTPSWLVAPSDCW